MAASTAIAAPGSLLGPRFSPGTGCQAISGIVPLRTHASARAERDTEVLFGERVTVLANRRGFMRVRADLDGKEGYVEARHFSDRPFRPTHRVCVPHVMTTRHRPVQSPELLHLGMNALVRVIETPDKFSRLSCGGWINHACLKPIGEHEEDFVEVACRFLRSPYLWGGRTGLGVDCSALIQAALIASGYACPRDSGPQSMSLGIPIRYECGLRRGDLVFWNGHVGVMVSRSEILHAADDCMRVVIEPLQQVIERRRREELPHKQTITVVRRLPGYA